MTSDAVVYTKSCPKCNEPMTYNDKFSLKSSIKKSTQCRKCARPKIIVIPELACPRCKTMRKFRCMESYRYAVNNNAICGKCNNRRVLYGNSKERIKGIAFLEKFGV